MGLRPELVRAASADPYPSRAGPEPRRLPRLDPVVHGGVDAPGPLTRAQLAGFEARGYLQLEGVFSASEVEALRAELERLRAGAAPRDPETLILEPGDRELRSIFAVHEQSPLFGRLARDERLVGLARQVLADEVYVHQSRLNYKPGFLGREFYWHSDFETWHVEDGMPRMRALSVALALTPNRESSGPLMLIPGSHLHYIACVGQTPEDHWRSSLRRQEYGVPDPTSLAWLVERGGIEAAKGPAGSLVVFDCNTMHGSNSNITPWPRSNAFIVYNACSNALLEPFGGARPRPWFVAARRLAARARRSRGQIP